MVSITIIACLQAVCLLAIVGLFIHREHQADATRAATERQWADERRELLNRIQQPDRLPLAAVDQFVIPEPEPDEIGLVGQILEPELEP